MLLVDTSIWIDHFRVANAALRARLRDRQIVVHPFVVGELVLGHLPRADDVVCELLDLPQATIASPNEILELVRSQHLAGSGIGYVDAHLVASARLMSAKLWTLDKRLLKVAERLSVTADLR